MSNPPVQSPSVHGAVLRRSSIDAQINRLATDLRLMQVLARADHPHARGAALATAHAALVLAVTPAADEDMQMIRHEALHDALPVFAEAGLGHVTPLIEAALAHDIVADRLARGVERLQ